MIYHQLHKKGRYDRKYLDGIRQQNDLQSSAKVAIQLANEEGKLDLLTFGFRGKACVSVNSSATPVKCLETSVNGICNRHLAGADTLGA